MSEIREMMSALPPTIIKPEWTQEKLLEEMEIINVTPTPGVCLKVKTNKGEKVFINVCLSHLVIRLMLLPEDSFGKNNFFFPKRYSKIRLEADNGGNLCKTFDIIINYEYFHETKNNADMWKMTLYFILDLPKYLDLTLDTKTVIFLKNRKVMGTLQTQSVLVPKEAVKRSFSSIMKSPLIQEISSSSTTVYDNTITSVQLHNKNKVSTTCNYVILKEPLNGIANNLIGLFQIPLGISSRDLIVLVDADSIIITNNENKVLYNLCVPYTLNTDKTESFFDKDLMILRLNMPVHKK